MKLIIELINDQVTVTTDESISIDMATNLIQTAQLQILSSAAEHAPPEHKERIRTGLYDMANLTMSTVLATFIPDKDLRPDITEEAIRNEELRIMSNVLSSNRTRT